MDLATQRALALTNGPVWVPDRITGAALQFDGVNDYVALPDIPSYDVGTGPRTLAARIQTTDDTGATVIIGGYRENPYPGYGLAMNILSFGRFSYWDGSNTAWRECFTNTIANGQWRTIAVSHDGTTAGASFYVDGGLDQTTASGNSVAASGFSRSIGALSGGSDNFFKGRIAWAMIFDRVLSAVDHARLHYDPYYYLTDPRRVFVSVPAAVGGATLVTRKVLLGVGS
jgi:hypothetical protein